MSLPALQPLAEVKALTFGMLGTVFSWRDTVLDELEIRAHRKMVSPELPAAFKARFVNFDWGRFAEQWRASYDEFTRNFDPTMQFWKSVDDHNRQWLGLALWRRGLSGLYTMTELDSLSMVWHRLSSHVDASSGLQALAPHYILATLSNANHLILRDLFDFDPAPLPFHHIFSAQDFRAYKPDPKTYRGAAERMGFQMNEVAMVASHLKDLQAARDQGMRTIYIERVEEESITADEIEAARSWVDLWIRVDEGGLVAVAEKLKEIREMPILTNGHS